MWKRYRVQCFAIPVVQTNGLAVKENTNASKCTAQNNSIYIFAFFILELVDERFKLCERLKPPAVIRNTATDKNHLIVSVQLMILQEADLHLLVLKRESLFDEDCDRVQYFGNCSDKDDNL